MEKYFPKTEYMYGTEFNKAKQMMEISMKTGLIGDKAGKELKKTLIEPRFPKDGGQKIMDLRLRLHIPRKQVYREL